MKYKIGDLIVEICYRYKKDYRKGYVTTVREGISPDNQVVGITWFDIEQEDAYPSILIDDWVSRNNAKHYPVNKDEEKEI
jgi:hypothetical protein